MAIKKNIKIDVKADAKDVKNLNNELKKTCTADDCIDDVNKGLSKTGDEAAKSSKKISGFNKGLKGVGVVGKKGFNALGSGIKGVGVAIKGAGIGLLLAAVAILFETLKKNQKVMDTFETVMTTISIVVNEVVSVFTDAIDSVDKSGKGFEALKKVVMGVITLAFTPFKLTLLAIQAEFYALKLAWEYAFGDDESIKAAKDNLIAIKNEAIKIKDDAIETGKEIAKNAGAAAEYVGKVVEKTVEGISKIDVKAAKASANAQTNAKKNAALALADNKRLIEEYDRAAEKLRQQRDDTSKSIAERIAANKALGKVLEESNKLRLKNAKIATTAAAIELKNNKDSTDAKVKYKEALAEEAAINAQIEGQKSEQLANETALNKERIDGIEDIKNTYIRSEEEKLAAEEAAAIKSAELLNATEKQKQDIRDFYAEIKKQKEEDLYYEYLASEAEKLAIDEANAIKKAEAAGASEEVITAIHEKYEKKRTDATKKEADAQIKIKAETEKASFDLGNTLVGIAQNVSGESTKASKLAGSAGVAISTTEGIMDVWRGYAKTTADLGVAGVAAQPLLLAKAIAETAAFGIKGARSIKSIWAVKNPYETGSGGGQKNIPAVTNPMPTYNVIGNSASSNDTMSEIMNQTTDKDKPIKAYVVSSEITTQQDLDKHIEEQITFN
jgi:hypothetical protein